MPGNRGVDFLLGDAWLVVVLLGRGLSLGDGCPASLVEIAWLDPFFLGG